MGIQQKINSISKLGYLLSIDIDEQGYIIAGIFYQSDANGMSASVLDPANEKGNDLEGVLSELVKRLYKQLKKEGKL